MEIQQKIEADIKTAMLAGDKAKAEILRGLKTAIQYETVSQNARETGLTDEKVQKVLAKESKKRADTATIYTNANEADRAAAELSEKAVIDEYLPEQASQADTQAAVNAEIATLDNPTPADMGRIIGAVRAKLGATADGGTIAKLVKEALE